MKNKKEKIKELYKKLKEAWQDPRKKAGIKLLSYFIFFFILLLFAGITNNIKTMNIKNNNSTAKTTTTKAQDKYIDKQNSLLTNKYNINYVINVNEKEYKINGTINNNIVEAYLESIDDIKKIIIKDNNIYEIKNNEEILLELDINKDLLSINYIINLIKQNSGLKEDIEHVKKYTYNIEDLNLNIVIEADSENITKISIVELNNKYELNFDK